MKRRSFLKNILFSAMVPVAMAFGAVEPSRVDGIGRDVEKDNCSAWLIEWNKTELLGIRKANR